MKTNNQEEQNIIKMAETGLKEVDATKKKKTRQKKQNDLASEKEPFVALGREENNYYYFRRLYRSVVKLTPQNHMGIPLLQLAEEDYWTNKAPNKGLKSNYCFQHCLQLTNGTIYDPSRVRSVGMWNEDGSILYNAGNACYAVENGEILPVDSVRPNGKVYKAGIALPEPGLEMMTDEQGKAFADFCNAYPWREERGGDLFAGLVVQALLSGFVPLRVHGWITAPAGSGKSTLLDRIDKLTGGLFCCMKGSSEAGVRQSINETSLPVGYDEAETDPGEKSGSSITAVLELSRKSSNGGNQDMGGNNGKGLTYYLNSSFLFFSINSALNKASNESRFMHLRLMPSVDKRPMDEAFKAAQDAVNASALISRMMHIAPVLLQNIWILMETLPQERRSKVFSVVLACRHALTSREIMTADQLAKAAALVEASTVAKVETDDATKCLYTILHYHPYGCGRDLFQLLSNDRNKDAGKESVAGEYGVKIAFRDGKEGIFIQYKHPIITKLFADSEWQSGCQDTLMNIQGAEPCKQKLRKGGNAVSGIWIPLYHVFDTGQSE